jgi:hypothetical protein
MKLSKLLLAVVGATVLLGSLVATASAGRLSSSSQTLRATFREVRFSGGFGTTVCNVTLEGSLHERTIAKAANNLIGYITAAAVGGCTQGSATILRETLPWHVRYQGFTGTLPAITTIVTRVINSSFQIREPVFGITCLARATEATPTIGTYNREASGALTTARISGSVPTNCGAEGTLEGTSNSLTELNSTTRITITLI